MRADCLNSACQVARPNRRFQSARISGAAFARGRRGTVDALIAGLSWFIGATVATRNPRDFERMGVPEEVELALIRPEGFRATEVDGRMALEAEIRYPVDRATRSGSQSESPTSATSSRVDAEPVRWGRCDCQTLASVSHP